MRTEFSGEALAFLSHHGTPAPIAKSTDLTRAWFATIEGREVFAKLYPKTQTAWASVEAEIAGGHLHPSIVPLESWVECSDGAVFIYPRVEGETLGSLELRQRFRQLPLQERASAVLQVAEALAAVAAKGFAVVDWYEGNMIYDFERRQIWLFDWELCRPGGSFVLEMEQNYGSRNLMAPEEFVKGSRIDEMTLVYNVGRYALLTLPEFAEPGHEFFSRATYPSRTGRFQTVAELAAELRKLLDARIPEPV